MGILYPILRSKFRDVGLLQIINLYTKPGLAHWPSGWGELCWRGWRDHRPILPGILLSGLSERETRSIMWDSPKAINLPWLGILYTCNINGDFGDRLWHTLYHMTAEKTTLFFMNCRATGWTSEQVFSPWVIASLSRILEGNPQKPAGVWIYRLNL